MAEATDLFDLAAEWLACLEAAVASTPGGAISETWVSADPPVIDCAPMLSVHTTGDVEAPTNPTGPLQDGQRPTLFAVHFIGLVATVIRCAPVVQENGTAPTTVEKETAANQTMSDLWACLNFTRQMHRKGLLFASPSGKRELFIDPQVVVPSSGGAVGWAIPIRVQLDGYSIGS